MPGFKIISFYTFSVRFCYGKSRSFIVMLVVYVYIQYRIYLEFQAVDCVRHTDYDVIASIVVVVVVL